MPAAKADLQSLLERVEKATFVNKSLMWDVCKTLNVDLDTIDNNGPTDIGGYIEARAWLSAAVALVEKVLPESCYEFKRRYRTTRGRVSGFVYLAHVSEGDHCEGATPALALCAALLRALISRVE